MKVQTHRSMLPQERWIGVHTGNHRRLTHCPVPFFGLSLHYQLPAVLAVGWVVENHAILGTPNSGKEKKKALVLNIHVFCLRAEAEGEAMKQA